MRRAASIGRFRDGLAHAFHVAHFHSLKLDSPGQGRRDIASGASHWDGARSPQPRQGRRGRNEVKFRNCAVSRSLECMPQSCHPRRIPARGYGWPRHPSHVAPAGAAPLTWLSSGWRHWLHHVAAPQLKTASGGLFNGAYSKLTLRVANLRASRRFSEVPCLSIVAGTFVSRRSEIHTEACHAVYSRHHSRGARRTGAL